MAGPDRPFATPSACGSHSDRRCLTSPRQAREHWASRLGARWAGTGVAEDGGAAAGGGRGRLHPALGPQALLEGRGP